MIVTVEVVMEIPGMFQQRIIVWEMSNVIPKPLGKIIWIRSISQILALLRNHKGILELDKIWEG